MNHAASWMLVLPLVLFPGLSSSSQKNRTSDSSAHLVLEAQAYSVTSLIDLSARFLGRNYLIQPMQVNCAPESQMVRLQNRLSLGRKDCEATIAQLISIYGWVLSPLDPDLGIYEWMNPRYSGNPGWAPRTLWLTPERILARPTRRIQVTTTLVLKYLDPDMIANRFRNMDQNNKVNVVTLANHRVGGDSVTVGGTILISGMCDLVAHALRVLQAADQEGARSARSLEGQLRTLKQRVQVLEDAAKHKKV